MHPSQEPLITSQAASVIFVDPQPLTRDGLGMWLNSKLGGIAISTAANVEDATRVMRGCGRASLVLYHIGSETMREPILTEALAQLSSMLPGVPVAVLAADDDWETILAVLRCGVQGYIPTDLPAPVIVEAIRLLCAGGSYAPVNSLLRSLPQCANEVKPQREVVAPAFSSRQLQIIRCLQRGYANKHIAFLLSMSEGTVKVHIRNIMKKLGAQNRTQIVIMTSAMLIDA